MTYVRDSNFCVSMIVNGRNGLGAIVLDVHQDRGEVRGNSDSKKGNNKIHSQKQCLIYHRGKIKKSKITL